MFAAQIKADAACVSDARALIVQELRTLKVSEQSIADAELILGELLANAILHSRPHHDGTIRACWFFMGDLLTIEVTDGGSASRARVRDASPDATSGRGLAIVEALSVTWGTQRITTGNTVWAQIPIATTGTAAPSAAAVESQAQLLR